jgi:RNA polymerase sigma factor (sigma-70 family)
MAQPPRLEQAVRDREIPAWLSEYGPALRRYFQRRVGPVEADDLLQEVVLAMHKRGGVAEIEHVGGYIFSVAARVLARNARIGGRMPRSGGDDHFHLLIDDLSPERSLLAKDSVQKLIEILQTLPPRAAQAFILHRFEEMSYAEIASHMGVSVRAVESHIKRTMDRVLAAMSAPL